MVYTGKPSRGCQTCKTRRIKCDEKRPICSQCQKSHRSCPGYPDEFDLVFRNENKVLERKARKASGSKTGGSEQGDSNGLSPTSSSELTTLDSNPLETVHRSRSRTPPHKNAPKDLFHSSYLSTFPLYQWTSQNQLHASLSTPRQDLATAFFFRNFVSVPQQAESMRGFLELLRPMWNQTLPSSALHLATNAVALAACGNYPGRTDWLAEATTCYAQAIAKLNRDLKRADMAAADETVLAILLFSLYETIMSTNSSMNAWAAHVDGAVALIKLRGTSQFSNPMSAAVFRAVRTLMITSCVQLSKPISAFPSPGGWFGASAQSEENAANRLTLLCIELPNLRARATELYHEPYSAALVEEAHAILAVAKEVDKSLLNWYRTLPPDWQYRTAAMVYEMPEDVASAPQWIGPQHVYTDVHIASIVNDYRVCRIFCQSVILACATWLNPAPTSTPSPTLDPDIDINTSSSTNYSSSSQSSSPKTPTTPSPDHISATFTIQLLVDEICACIPYHTSYNLQSTPQRLNLDRGASEALGGYFLVWPLYVAANAETIPQRQREWLQGRLVRIGEEFRLSAAQVLVLARRHVLTCGPIFELPGAGVLQIRR